MVKQTAYNRTIEEKLGKIDILASKVDSLAHDVELLKLKVLPNDVKEQNTFATANAIQVRIDENVRLLAELHARCNIPEFANFWKIKKIKMSACNCLT
jgi:hypothetical protein